MNQDMFDVQDITDERDAVAAAVFYRELLGAVKDIEEMLVGYLAYSGREVFTVGSVTIQKKDGSKTYDHEGEVERFAAVSDTAAEKVKRAVKDNTETVVKTSWSKVSKAVGLKVTDMAFTQGDPKVDFVVGDKKVKSIPWVEEPEADLVQPTVNAMDDNDIPF